MKKFLAVCSILVTVCAAFASCGANDMTNDSNNGGMTDDFKTEEKYESNVDGSDRDKSNNNNNNNKNDRRRNNDVKDDVDDAGDYVDGVIEGAEDAGEDVIEGAGDAAQDFVDGLDGENDRTTKNDKRNND